MSQLSLNLVAISVFVMTFSALLYPVLNVSPFWPAGLTFGLLGLATLDSFSLKGTGGALVLDALGRFSSEYRDRILHHEAGHFLVAYLLQIPVTDYSLSAWDALKKGTPGQGGVQFDLHPLSAESLPVWELQRTVDRFCTLWMAGIAAEIITYGNSEGGADDRQKLQAVLMELGRSNLETQQKERWSIHQAKTLIADHPAAYDALVAQMAKRASVSDCYHILQSHLGQLPSLTT